MPYTPVGSGKGESSSGKSSSGGGGYTPIGGGGGSSSRSGGGGGGTRTRRTANRQIFQTLARLNAIKNPQKRAQAQQYIGQALEGFSGEEITRLAQKAGLTPGDVNAITAEAGAEHIRQTGTDFVTGLSEGLDYLDRVTARPAKNAIVESQGLRKPWKAPGAAVGAVMGDPGSPGAQAILALASGGTPKETAKARRQLPGPARVALDFGGDVVFDWSNWITLGGGALADNAARVVAKAAVGQAAEDAALNTAAAKVFKALTTKGYKGLTREQRELAEEAFTGRVPRAIQRKVNRSRGGMRVAGVLVPGTDKLNRQLDRLGVKPGGLGSGAEADLRVRGGLRQEVRADPDLQTLPQDVENILAQQRGAQFPGDLGPRRATRGVEDVIGQALGKRAQSRAGLRAGRKFLAEDPEILTRVARALDVGGGKTAVANLGPMERDIARYLRGLSDEDFEALKDVGRLNDLPEGQIISSKKMGRVARLIQKAQKDVDAQAARLAAVEAKGAEFRNIPAIQRPSSGEFGPSHFVGEDVKLAEQFGRERAKLVVKQRRLAGLEQQLKTLREKAPTITPQDQYLYRYRVNEAGTPTLGGSRTPGFLKRRTNRGVSEEMPWDPRVSMGLHQKGTAQEVATVRALEDLERMGTGDTPMAIRPTVDDEGVNAVAAFKEANPGWADTYEEVNLPQLHGPAGKPERVLVHKAVAPYYTRAFAGMKSGAIRRNVEYLNALWARMATSTVGFVSRNVLQGNLFMGMVLGEARNPYVWARSLGTMKRLQQGIVRMGDPYAFLKDTERELIEGAMRDNAVESGFLDIIAKQTEEAVGASKGRTAKALKGSRLSPVSPNFVPWERISAANQWMENWSRLSVYANKVKQGYASPEAAAITRRVMLDYRDLAPANEALRLVNPFMTWTYKSAPLIMGTLVRDPRKIKIPLALLNAVNAEGQRSEGAGIIPRWQTEAGAITLPKGLREVLPLGLDQEPQAFLPGTPIHTTLEALQPLFDLAHLDEPTGKMKLGQDIINLIGAGGVPGGGVKAAAEAVAQKKFFSGQEMTPGQRVTTPAPLRPLFGDTMPWETANALESLIPILSRSATVLPQNDYERDVQGRRVASQLGGVSLYPQGKAASRSEKYRRLAVLEAVIRSLKDQGVKVPTFTEVRQSRGG